MCTQAHKEHIRAHERQLAARSLYGKLYASLEAHGGTAACVYNMASAMNKLDNVSTTRLMFIIHETHQ
jgi:hypothetical protein